MVLPRVFPGWQREGLELCPVTVATPTYTLLSNPGTTGAPHPDTVPRWPLSWLLTGTAAGADLGRHQAEDREELARTGDLSSLRTGGLHRAVGGRGVTG